tara:strand:- start:5708 stop:6946 length:1239 start_codon:yes stop_codon:yes gene_type:complete
MMRILQVLGAPLKSGAGRGAAALNDGLRRLGVDSVVLGKPEKNLPEGVVVHQFPVFQRLVAGICNRLYRKVLKHRFGSVPDTFQPISFGLLPNIHPEVLSADLMHVQWSNAGVLGPGFWKGVRALPLPLVFTLRDMWLFTGGCHFSGGCLGYETGCTQCPMLNNMPQSITSTDLGRKAETLKYATVFVAISENIAEKARRSAVLKDADIRVIPNSVATHAFTQIDKEKARRELGVPADKFIIAFGALNLSEVRKGSEVMKEVILRLGDEDSFFWLAFGGQPIPLPESSTYFGVVDDQHKLNLIYAAADLFIMPSLEESFGKTTAEALLSGTAVVAFDGTPAEEIVLEGRTGWIVPNGDADAVVVAIGKATTAGSEVLAQMGQLGRRDVASRFSLEAIAKAHIKLYRELLGLN